MDEQYDVIVLGTGLKVSVSVCMGWTAMLLTHGSECLPFMIACAINGDVYAKDQP